MRAFNTFIGQSFKNFVRTGAVLPSSSRLAKMMTKDITDSIVLELGPGTGVFTKAILNKLPEDGKLISIESNEIFVKYLKDNIKDKRLVLYSGDALKLRKFLEENGIKKINCVISGLPLGHFKKEFKDKILKEIADCLEEDGTYVQFQYFLVGIFAIRKVFSNVSIGFEPFNFPPAFVIKCKKNK